MTFAEYLRREQERLLLTQKEMADLLGIPKRTYWEYRSGATEPVGIAQEGARARLEKTQPK